MRYLFLVPILVIGAWVAIHSLKPVSDPEAAAGHASATLNILIFYLLSAGLYLAANKTKDWKIVVPYSVMILLFVVRLLVSFPR